MTRFSFFRFLKLLSLALILFSISPTLAVAQTPEKAKPAQSTLPPMPSPSQQKKATGPNPFEDLPEEYIQEAQNFHQQCQTQETMNKYYNCECLALKFLDERIKRGPGIDKTLIISAIDRECADATEASGQEYNLCMESMTPPPPGMSAEKYCSCYANNYAKLYEKYSPGPGAATFVQLQTHAHLMCRKPELAKKLFPYQPERKKNN